MVREYYEEISFRNNKVKLNCIFALKKLIAYDWVFVMKEAVKTAHQAHGITERDFWDGIFVPAGTRYVLADGNQRRGSYPADAYDELEDAAWFKYLLFGDERIYNDTNLTDALAFFDYFNIAVYRNRCDFTHADRNYNNALKRAKDCRNKMHAHDNPAHFGALTFSALWECRNDLLTILKPLTEKKWNLQDKCWQLYAQITEEFYNSLGEVEYTVSNLMNHVGIPATDTALVEELFTKADLKVAAGMVTFTGDPTKLARNLEGVWSKNCSIERKASLLRSGLQGFTDRVVGVAFQGSEKLDAIPDEALQEYAQENNHEAEYLWAVRLLKKQENIKKNRESAKKYLKKAADAGLAKAQAYLAQLLLEEDNPEAGNEITELLIHADSQKESYALLVWGEVYASGRYLPGERDKAKDEQRAYEYFKRAAEEGCKPAQVEVAWCELCGIGTEKDDFAFRRLQILSKTEPKACGYLGMWLFDNQEKKEEAISLLRQGAENNDRRAAYYLGIHYGQHLLNTGEKVRLWQASADMGYLDAIAALGEYYYAAGKHKLAFSYLTDAAQKGHKNAQYQLGDYYSGYVMQSDKVEAFRWYLKAAEQGHLDAQYKVGECYWFGTGTAKDKTKALKWYLKAAEQEHLDAQYKVGKCYWSYWSPNYWGMDDRALKWFLKAAEGGHAEAQYTLGLHYEESTENESFEWYLKAAKQGHVGAQYSVGECYFNGKGTAKDETKAFEWHLRAAKQGHLDAQYMVGLYYYKGRGTAVNKAEAFKWSLKAVERGHRNAQYIVGLCYYYGEGIAQNKEEGFRWCLKAAEQGYAQAMYMVAECYSNGEGTAKDKTESFDWYLKAAEQGHVDAQYYLAEHCKTFGMFLSERNTKTESFDWYLKAAEQGHLDAQYKVGECYFWGRGTTKDETKTFEWQLKAAKQGHLEAQYMVCLYYYKGRGTAVNKVEAFKWALKAVKQGHRDAQYIVGLCYYYGEGIAQNKEEGFRWFLKTAEQGYARAMYMVGECYWFGTGTDKDTTKAFEWHLKAAEQGILSAMKRVSECYTQGIGVAVDKKKGLYWSDKASKQQ